MQILETIKILGLKFDIPYIPNLKKKDIYDRFGNEKVTKNKTHHELSEEDCDLIFSTIKEKEGIWKKRLATKERNKAKKKAE